MDKSQSFPVLSEDAFFQRILQCLRNELGSGCRIRLETVWKNNGLLLHAVIITEDRLTLSPALYLEPYYQDYRQGIPVATLARRIAASYRSRRADPELDADQVLPSENVNQRILFRLVHWSRNRELLKNVPHIPFLDLAVVFYFTVSHSILGTGSCLLQHSHLEALHLKESELWPLALVNTPALLPARIQSMQELLPKMLEALAAEDKEALPEQDLDSLFPPGGSPMYVLTNPSCSYGAACLLYPGVLSSFAKKLGSDLYILPSSIHEAILMPAASAPDQAALARMVRDVNRTDVPICDQLSDRVYLYSRKLDQIVY